jgi:PiT family inorganic phosphate transporter
VCSGSVIGSGAGRKLSRVRWGMVRRMVYGWTLTLPAAALFGAVAAAVALTGPIGIVIVLGALVAGTVAIVTISRRTAVTSHNVNEARDVTVRFSRTPAAPAMAAAGAPARVIPEPIPPIIIRPPALPHTNETTTNGQQS